MRTYSIASVSERADDTIHVKLIGPGIPRAGVVYWFPTVDEAHRFVEDLNTLYRVQRLGRY